jgi:dienelactone hydrolase
MKLRLVVISDLWGFENSLWIENYTKNLNSYFDLVFYNSRELAGIENDIVSEKEIHSKFMSGGIRKAINNLRELEKNEIDILSFSIGGTIAWKATLEGLKTNNLFAISSTRLRYEIEKPNCNIQLIFGGNDKYKPNKDWSENLNLTMNIIKDGEHDIYTESNVINGICERIKTHHNKV